MGKKASLWIKNNTGSDVMLNDLGVKVVKDKTIDVFKYNPYLTVEKVEKSLENGSLSKRLNNKALSVVKGPSNKRPHNLDKIEQSKESVMIKSTKTSVIVEPNNPELDEDSGEEDFSFADYGINDLGPVEQKKDSGSVVVSAQQDNEPEEESDAKVEPIKSTSPANKQSTIIMEAQAKAASHPMGKVAESSNIPAASQPFIVSKAPNDEKEKEPAQDWVLKTQKKIEQLFQTKDFNISGSCVRVARKLVIDLAANNLEPKKVLPTTNHGISFLFKGKNTRIDVRDSSNVLLVLGKKKSDSFELSIDNAIIKLSDFLSDKKEPVSIPEKKSKEHNVQDGMVTSSGVVIGRNIELSQALTKRAEELGVDVDDLPEKEVTKIESKVIGDKIIKDDAKDKFDSQVATKTEKGATVMKFREVSKKTSK